MDGNFKRIFIAGGRKAGRTMLAQIATDIARSWGYTVVEVKPKTGAPVETEAPE